MAWLVGGVGARVDQGVGCLQDREDKTASRDQHIDIRRNGCLPESLLSGASVFTPTPLSVDTPRMARFCTWRQRGNIFLKRGKQSVEPQTEQSSPQHQQATNSTDLVVVRLTAGGGSWRHFLFSLRLLANGCAAGHEDELRGDGGP